MPPREQLRSLRFSPSMASLPSSSPSSAFSPDGDEGVGVRKPPRLSSFAYHRLPEPFLRLTVLKLDGSSFDVEVARAASVWELKMAVEALFSRSPEHGGVSISWSHVWGHFCLCYEDHKLIDDRAFLRSFGVTDGDKLQFIKHLSINYNPAKRRPKFSRQNKLLLTGPDVEETKENHEDNKSSDTVDASQQDDQDYHSNDESKDLIEHTESKLAQFLRGWLSYTRLWSYARTRSARRTQPLRFGSNWGRICSKPKR